MSARWRWLPRSPHGWLIVLSVYAFALGVGKHFEYVPVIPWSDYQLLAEEWLRRDGLRAVFCLHSQPPGYNALVWICAALSTQLGAEPQLLLGVTFWAIGLLGALALWQLSVDLLGGRGGPLAMLLLHVGTPAFQWYSHMLTYEFLVANYLLISVASLRRYVTQRSLGWLLAAWSGVLAVVYTRTLFAPAWGALLLGGLILRYPPVIAGAAGGRRTLVVALVCCMSCGLWPLKNWLVYDQFTNSSWTGYNMQRGTELSDSSALRPYLAHGTVPPDAPAEQRSPYCAVLAQNRLSAKPNGARNWHHAIFLDVNTRLVHETVEWWSSHPAQWLSDALHRYLAATRPTYTHPYSGRPFNPPSALLMLGDTLATKTFFWDLRPSLEPLLPDGWLAKAEIRGKPLPMTLYGLLILPLSLVGTLAWLINRRSSLHQAAWATQACIAFCVSWNIVVPCLSDGVEANRMRYATSSLAMLLPALLLGRALCYARSRYRRREFSRTFLG